MISELERLKKEGTPERYYHWNSARVEQLKQKLLANSSSDTLSIWFEYCQELLRGGDTESCIHQIETFLTNSGYNLHAGTKPLFELLAIAYLRLGEQENCQKNHSKYSCIVPIKGSGEHRFEDGSTNAMELYTRLFNQFGEMRYKWLANLAAMTLGKHPDEVPSEMLLSVPQIADFPRFNEIAEEMNINSNGLSGGVCIDDFNGDGMVDIFTTSYGMNDNVQLYLGQENGVYVNSTDSSNLKGIVSGLNCVHADYDNDGDNDIFVLRGAWLGDAGNHPNSLLQNQGDGRFLDVTRTAGLLSYHPTQTACWADFNNDGHLDLFIGNETTSGQAHPCELFLNNGNGSFSEVAESVGLGTIAQYLKGSVWGDVNNDGWQDLFVSVLGGNNLLFLNQKGTFTEVSATSNVQKPHYGFSCWFWDVNNDGWQDLYVGSYDLRFMNDVSGEFARELDGVPQKSERSCLYLNNGDGTFSNRAKEFGVDKALFGMGANFGDIDNDGFLDFYIGNGSPEFNSVVPNRMFRNIAGTKFEDISFSGGFGHVQKGHGTAFSDIDRDGDQDLYMVIGGAYEGDNFTNVLFDNPGNANNWITLKLQGNLSNRSAVGTKLVLKLNDGRIIHRTVSTGGSFGSGTLQAEIGIGNATEVKELIIIWPCTGKQLLKGLEINTIHHLLEPSGQE